MAEKFEIQRARTKVRGGGPNVRATHVPRTTGNELMTGLLKLGVAVNENVILEIGRNHSETKFSKARMAANDRMGKQLAKELYDEQDPEKYQSIYEKAIAEANGNRPDDFYAGPKFDKYIDLMQPAWNKGMFGDYVQRVAQNKREQDASDKAKREAIVENLLTTNQIAFEDDAKLAKDKDGKRIYTDAEARKIGQEKNALLMADPKFRQKHNIPSGDISSQIRNINEQADVRRAIKERQDKENEKVVTRNAYGKLWDGELTEADVMALNAEVVNGNLSVTARNDIVDTLSGKGVKVNDTTAQAEVLRALRDKEAGVLTETEAEKVLTKNQSKLTPTTNSKYLERLIGDGDSAQAREFISAKRLMTELIRSKEFGDFTDDTEEILGDNRAQLILDLEMEQAAASGKPLRGRDLKIRAQAIGLEVKDEVKRRKSQPATRPGKGFFGGTEKIPEEDRVKRPQLDRYREMDNLDVAPEGLEMYWPRLNTETRRAALDLISRGKSTNDIARSLEKKLGE